MSNAFSYAKCHNFGKSIADSRPGITWSEVEKDEEWIAFKKKHDLTDNQLYYIHLGFIGKPLQDTEERDKPDSNSMDDNLFPFGTHKNRKFSQVPMRYIEWLSGQDWLEKWPIVQLYVKQRMKASEENKLSKDDISNLLRLD